MRRNLLISYTTLLALLCGATCSYGTDTDPTAIIVSPDPDEPKYIEPGGEVSFDGEGSGTATPPTGSYDGDNGGPDGGGTGIDTFTWYYYHNSEKTEFTGGSTNETFDEAGYYQIYLKVTDDDDPAKDDEADKPCKVYAVKVEIAEPKPEDFTVYIGLETDLTLEAKVTPSEAVSEDGTFTWSIESGGTASLDPTDEDTTSFSASTTGQYTVKVKYEIDGETFESDISGTIEVCDAKMIFKTGSPAEEASSLERTETGTFEIVDGDGDTITDAEYSDWKFESEADGTFTAFTVSGEHTTSTWDGMIVGAGEASCQVTMPGIPEDEEITVNKSITVDARTGSEWSLTPGCDQDNHAEFGAYPGLVVFGKNRDRDNDDTDIIWPRGNNFADGYTASAVDGGPNDGVYYISASTFAIDRETCINKYIKPGTTGYPDPPGENWHEFNEKPPQNADADGMLLGLRGHEYCGTGSNGQGHQQFIIDEEDKEGNDVKTEIEDNVGSTEENLKSATYIEVLEIDNAIFTAGMEEPTGNWSGTLYLYDFSLNQWETSSEEN